MRGLFPFMLAAAGCLLPACASPGGAQTAEEVLNAALDLWETSTADIERYTLVQETMGFETAVTFEKRSVDGQPVFVPLGENDGSGWGDPSLLYRQAASRARLEGEEQVDGEATFVVVVDDFEGIDVGELASGGEAEFAPRQGWFYIDADEHLLRRMRLEGETTRDGETAPFAVDARLRDYRQVEGMWHPFLVQVTAEGTAPDVSEADLQQAREAMAQMDEQMAQVPEAQRAMVENMLKPQMERLEEILASGRFEVLVETRELLVNESP